MTYNKQNDNCVCLLCSTESVPAPKCTLHCFLSLSAQTSTAIGAVLNATFGSIVEIILYTTALVKGHQINPDATCYQVCYHRH